MPVAYTMALDATSNARRLVNTKDTAVDDVDYISYMINVLREEPPPKFLPTAESTDKHSKSSVMVPAVPPLAGTISLAQLLDAALFRIYDDFTQMLELGHFRSGYNRKVMLATFARNAYCRLTCFYGTAKWMSNIGRVRTAGLVMKDFADTFSAYAETANFFHELCHKTCSQSKLPCFRVPLAVEILTTGAYLRFPGIVGKTLAVQDYSEKLIGADDACSEKHAQVTKKLERNIRARLFTSSWFGQQNEKSLQFKIENGCAELSMPDEFKLILTLNGTHSNAAWFIVSLTIDPRLISTNSSSKSQQHSLLTSRQTQNVTRYLQTICSQQQHAAPLLTMRSNVSSRMSSTPLSAHSGGLKKSESSSSVNTVIMHPVSEIITSCDTITTTTTSNDALCSVLAVVQDLCIETKLYNIIAQAQKYFTMNRAFTFPPFRTVYSPGSATVATSSSYAPTSSSSSVSIFYWISKSSTFAASELNTATMPPYEVKFSANPDSSTLNVQHNPPLFTMPMLETTKILPDDMISRIDFDSFMPLLLSWRTVERLALLHYVLQPYIPSLRLHLLSPIKLPGGWLHIPLPVSPSVSESINSSNTNRTSIRPEQVSTSCALRIYVEHGEDGRCYVARQYLKLKNSQRLSMQRKQMHKFLDMLDKSVNILLAEIARLLLSTATTTTRSLTADGAKTDEFWDHVFGCDSDSTKFGKAVMVHRYSQQVVAALMEVDKAYRQFFVN